MAVEGTLVANHNDRRVQAAFDTYSPVSHIGISYAIQNEKIEVSSSSEVSSTVVSVSTTKNMPVRQMRIKSSMYFNLDGVSCEVGGDGKDQIVYLSA